MDRTLWDMERDVEVDTLSTLPSSFAETLLCCEPSFEWEMGREVRKFYPLCMPLDRLCLLPWGLNRVGLGHIPCLCWTGLLLVELLLIGIPSSNILNSLSARDRIPFPNRPLVSSIEGRGTFGMWPKSPKQISWFHWPTLNPTIGLSCTRDLVSWP